MPSIEGEISPEVLEKFQNEFRLLPGETLAGVLAAYDEVAARTDELLVDVARPGRRRTRCRRRRGSRRARRWSARRVFLHIVAETAQHAGHADIIRETIDGQKTMG